MADKLRVGIIGASVSGGWGARAHTPGIAHLPDVELKAVATTRQETADASAREFGAEKGYSSFMDLVADSDIDLVSVVVKVPSHYEPTMAAIEAGKNVYCEWPLGRNTAEAEEMTKAAAAKGVLNAVGMQGRLDPTQNYVKKLIADGYLGEVLAVHMTYFRDGVLARPSSRTWQRDKDLGATTLTIIGGHAIDSITYCLGEFAEVSARVVTRVNQWLATDTNEMLDVTAPDNVLISGVLKSGAVVSAHVGTLPYHGEGYKLEVWGREGQLVMTSPEGPNIGPMLLSGSKGPAPLEPMPVPSEYVFVPEDMPKGAPFNIAQIYARTADALKQGQSFNAPTFADAVRHHKLLDAIDRASAEGRAIPIE
jgi:predicted dehydrogenase